MNASPAVGRVWTATKPDEHRQLALEQPGAAAGRRELACTGPLTWLASGFPPLAAAATGLRSPSGATMSVAEVRA